MRPRSRSARVDIDTRFVTTPTMLKRAAMALGVLCVIASVVTLAVLDRRAGRRLPARWRRFWRTGLSTWLADVGVIGTLLLWHVIGPLSSDDGYNITIARVAGEAGYTANYFRYFGAAEAPFDWYQAVLAHLAAISPASVWMRVPATLAGIGTWLLLSRWALPRLGRAIATHRVAVWTAGAVFVAAWLPFNNGLRPEPLIALGVLFPLYLNTFAAIRQLDPWMEKLQGRELEPRLAQVRWALEEWRIGLFAQPMKTRYPVSDKRLAQWWAEQE